MRIYATPEGMSEEQVQDTVQYMKARRNNRGEFRYDNEIERKIQILDKMQFSSSVGHFSVSHGNRVQREEMEYAVIIKVITKGNNRY